VKGANPIHWLNGKGPACGAPVEANACPYQLAVTCRECIVILKVDVLKRRLEAHRFSVALGRVRGANPKRS
jgi:hypothetical protein